MFNLKCKAVQDVTNYRFFYCDNNRIVCSWMLINESMGFLQNGCSYLPFGQCSLLSIFALL